MIRLGDLLRTHGPRLFGRHYYWWSLVFQLRGDRGKCPILVFQMGKVGSRTVNDALRRLALNTAVIHAHVLSPEGIREGEVSSRSWSKSRQERWRNEYLRRIIETGGSERRWQVISLVRDPIARNVSAFFQNLDIWQQQELDNQRPVEIPELQQRFMNEFDHDRPLVWFDREIKPLFGIDVLAHEFPQEKGYAIYHGAFADLLVIKLEKIDKCITDAMQEFLGIEGFLPKVQNLGSMKTSGPIYCEFKESLVLSNDYIERLYQSRFVRHFYSPVEVDAMSAYWLSRGPVKGVDRHNQEPIQVHDNG